MTMGGGRPLWDENCMNRFIGRFWPPNLTNLARERKMRSAFGIYSAQRTSSIPLPVAVGHLASRGRRKNRREDDELPFPESNSKPCFAERHCCCNPELIDRIALSRCQLYNVALVSTSIIPQCFHYRILPAYTVTTCTCTCTVTCTVTCTCTVHYIVPCTLHIILVLHLDVILDVIPRCSKISDMTFHSSK